MTFCIHAITETEADNDRAYIIGCEKGHFKCGGCKDREEPKYIFIDRRDESSNDEDIPF